MTEDNTNSGFSVDAERCIGCGVCADSCPMKILKIENDVCVMTDISKCLECGTCIRDCPQDAIVIPGVRPPKGRAEQPRKEAAPRSSARRDNGAGAQFTPILQHLSGLLQKINPVQVFEHEGTDIRSLDEFDLEGQACFCREYTAEKLEKIGMSRMNFYGSMVADVLVMTPGRDYDIPYFVMDWDESDEHVFFICDLMPSDDPGRNMRQLQNYLYDPLEDLYQACLTIPGMKPSVFHWVRAIHSPYLLTGTIEKAGDNIDRLFQCAADYCNAWLAIYGNARPQKPGTGYMKLIHERRKTIRALYRENDPGVGSLNKFLGDTMAGVALSIMEP